MENHKNTKSKTHITHTERERERERERKKKKKRDLSGELLPGGLSSFGFAGGLLGTGHYESKTYLLLVRIYKI
jgi:hypothetical protein